MLTGASDVDADPHHRPGCRRRRRPGRPAARRRGRLPRRRSPRARPRPGRDPRRPGRRRAARRLAADVHGDARQPRRHQRAARPPGRARRHAHRPAVGGERLHAGVRDADDRRRDARRPLGPAPHVPRRDRGVHPRLDRRGPRRLPRRPDRRPRRPGRRRRGRHAAVTHPARRRGPRVAARHGHRHLGRRLRPRRRALPEGRGRAQRLDLPGLVLAAAGVLGIVWGVVHGNEDGWTSAGVLGPIVGGVVALALFLAHEARTPHALVPLRLFRSRSFSVANVSGFAFSLGAFGAVFLLAQYLQIVQGYSPLEAGLRTLPWTAAPMVVAPLAGMLAPRVGVRVLLTGGLVAQAAGLAWLGFAVSDGGYAALVPRLVLAGVGMGLTFAPSATAVLSGMAPDDHGTASSTNSTLREVGVALGVAVLTAVFTAAGGTISPDGFDAGLRPAVLTGAAVIALAAVASLAMPRGTGREDAREDA